MIHQLDQFYEQAKRQILQNQSAITGLFPSNSAEKSNASIKTSLWAASSIFALYLAYSKRVDNDKGKAHDLGQSVVKCMRGILFAWMRQSEKVESFKANQSPKHALHLKFDLHSGLANDFEYPHLQIDVVSLYLVFLANFIASGLDIIYCMDEVTFIQNLVYYVERAYRTPDYGNWEQNAPSSLFQRDNNQALNNQHVISSTPINQPNNNYNEQPINYHNHNPNGDDGRSLEIHATSIGMAKSALEAINGCNLFGGKGANWSIIYSDIDAHSRNRSIFETLLPRESRSRNTDSYLLCTISWPCFATHDPSLYQSTKSKILRKLKGKFGLKRYLRDSYGTALKPEVQNGLNLDKTPAVLPATKDNLQQLILSSNGNTTMNQTNNIQESSFTSNRNDLASTRPNVSTTPMLMNTNEPPKLKQRKSSYFQRKHKTQPNQSDAHQNQLLQRVDSNTIKMSKRFEHIESEWPLFVCFLIIDGIFKQDMEQVYEHEKMLYERLLIVDKKLGDYLMPKYYYVPQDLISNEKCNPDTVDRLPSVEGSSTDQLYLTGQSILLITRLLLAGLVHPNELDPLRRHMPSYDRPKKIGRYSSFQATSSDLVVQTVLIAESIRLQAMMANYGIQTQTPLEVEPVQIWSSSQLVKVYEYLGVNEKLGLKGRPSRPIGALGTSKLYRICGQTILCYPLIFEVSDFYLAQDMLLLIDDIQNELNFIGRYWRMSGRPTVCILIREEHLRDVHFRDLLDLLVQFKNGQLKKSGLRIKTGRLQNLISSSCIEHLDFLHLLPHEHLPQFKSFRQLVESPKQSLLMLNGTRDSSGKTFSNKTNRRHLCSASSHNLQAIEEAATSSSPNNSMFELDQEPDQEDSPSRANISNLSFHIEDPLQFNNSKSSANGHYNGSSIDVEFQNYSTKNSNSIDYYECYKAAPTWPTIVEILRTLTQQNELAGQSQLLAVLYEREGSKYIFDDSSVEDQLEKVSQRACLNRNWSVVRYCSAVLKRSVESLSPWLTSILVNGKQISLGAGTDEKIINNPLTPIEIHTLIYSTIKTKNPCDAVLQQEIALYIGRLISTRPDYFEGILTIRVTNFMSAMRSYLNIKTNERKLLLQQELLDQQQRQQQQLEQMAQLEDSNSSTSVANSTISDQNNWQHLLDLRIKPAQQVESALNLSQSNSHSPPHATFELGLGNSCQPDQFGSTSYQLPQIKVEPASNSQTPIKSGSFSRFRSSARSSRSNHSYSSLIAKPLESLSPSDVRKLLVKVLTDDNSMPISDRRQITGELCRVPRDFYDKVWSLLSCTNVGIVIGGKILRSIPILTNMTQDDLNFALKVESLLSGIDCPKLRQVNVELLMALHVILERNPEIRFESDPLDLDKIINLSLEKFRSDFNRDDYGLKEYYAQTVQTTMLYTVRTVFDCLLPVKYKGRAECRLS